MLEWFKTKDDKCHIDGIKENDISIDLPDQSIKRTTIRVNNTVWECLINLQMRINIMINMIC